MSIESGAKISYKHMHKCAPVKPHTCIHGQWVRIYIYGSTQYTDTTHTLRSEKLDTFGICDSIAENRTEQYGMQRTCVNTS